MADWSELKRLAEEAQSTFGSFDPSEAEFDLMAAITPDVILALIAENKQLCEDHDKQWRLAQSGIQNIEAVLAENAKLRAEVEALRISMREVMGQVDGNIRELARDLVNRLSGLNNGANPNDLHGYCDTIERAIDAAMGKGGRADG